MLQIAIHLVTNILSNMLLNLCIWSVVLKIYHINLTSISKFRLFLHSIPWSTAFLNNQINICFFYKIESHIHHYSFKFNLNEKFEQLTLNRCFQLTPTQHSKLSLIYIAKIFIWIWNFTNTILFIITKFDVQI